MNIKNFIHQSLFLLNKKEKKKIFLCLIFLIFTGILEALSIGLILPLATIIFDQTKLVEYLGYLNIMSIENLDYKIIIFYSLTIVFFIYLFKNIFLLCSELFQINFLLKAQKRVEIFFYKNYINRSFKFHRESNSSKLIQTIIGEIKAYFSRVIKQSLILINEIIVIIFITIVILFSLPKEGFLLIFGVTFFFFIIYYLSIRKYITRLGKSWKIAETSKLNHARDGFASISDVKIYDKESFFINLYNQFNSISLRSRKYLSILQYLPRLLLEMIFISLFILFLIFIVNKEQNFSLYLPQITLIVVASFRLMPSINKLLLASSSIRFGLPLIDHLIKEYQKFQNDIIIEKSLNEIKIEPVKKIKFSNISFNYSNNIKILKNLNFEINEGKIFGIKGSNGTGKSTLAYLISGLLSPVDGQVILNDEKKQFSEKILLKNSSYLSQNLFLFDDTILANITFNKNKDTNQKRLHKVLESFDLNSVLDKYKEKIDYVIGENGENLSSGQRQRIGLARTFYFNKKIIILDEATNAIDEKSEKNIFEKISNLKENKIIIVISHKSENLDFCDQILDLDKKFIS